METVSAPAFHATGDLPEWRFLLGRIEASYVADSFASAAAFVQRLAEAAEAAGHHPDVDLRHPARVNVALTTLSVDGLTTADVELATTISSLAAGSGLTSEPVPSRLEIAIDALDIDAVRPFWQAVLAYVEWPPRTPGGQVEVLVDPVRSGPAFWFQQMDAPRPQRNRIHIDVTVPHDEAEARIAAALAAGGRMVSDSRARAFWILADAEGNEACVCTWQDRN